LGQPDAFLGLPQLLHALSEKLAARSSTSNIRATFRKFDENKDGTVSYPEFRQVGALLCLCLE
jgi:Ca2+-binding EF-hand superfamily protein